MADGRHFGNRYISISQPRIVRIWRNLVGRRKFWPRRRKRDTNSEIRKFKMADGRHIENHFLARTRLHIVRLRWNLSEEAQSHAYEGLMMKIPSSKIQHGGLPPFWKSLYLHISAANGPNCMKAPPATSGSILVAVWSVYTSNVPAECVWSVDVGSHCMPASSWLKHASELTCRQTLYAYIQYGQQRVLFSFSVDEI